MDNNRVWEFFKLRSRKTGLWHTGGRGFSVSYFNKNGKVWQGRGPFNQFLAQFRENHEAVKELEECEVIRIETTIPEILE